jgi:hypothetical protein
LFLCGQNTANYGRPFDNSPFPTVQGRLSSAAMMMGESLFAMHGINGKNPGIRTVAFLILKHGNTLKSVGNTVDSIRTRNEQLTFTLR